MLQRKVWCLFMQDTNRHRLRIPRRPPWSRDMTGEQVEAQERDAFLAWRRDLARCCLHLPHKVQNLLNYLEVEFLLK